MNAMELRVNILIERITILEALLNQVKAKMDEDLRQHEKDIVILQRQLIGKGD